MNLGNNIRETTYLNNLISANEDFKDRASNYVGRKPFYEAFSGGMATTDKKKIIFIGIIDVFTQYG